MTEVQRLRKALADIAKAANDACVHGPHSQRSGRSGPSLVGGSYNEFPSCVLKALPDRLTIDAAQTAMRINPVNAPAFGPMTGAAMDLDVMNSTHDRRHGRQILGPDAATADRELHGNHSIRPAHKNSLAYECLVQFGMH